MEAKLAAGVPVEPDKRRDIKTVADLLDWYLATDEAKAKKSASHDHDRAKNIKPLIGDVDAFKLTSAALSQYKRDRLAMPRSSPQTVQHELAVLHRAYVVAVEELDWRLPNGIPKTRRPVIDSARDRRVKPDELARLVAACESPDTAALMELAVETAMRRGELVALEWERVDFARKSVYLDRTKTGSPRTVPLSPRAMELLQARYREGDTGLVFTIQPGSVSQALRRAAKRAGSKDLRFHDLRHEATSRLFEHGLNQIEVARITGHKTLSMLNRYTHLDVEHLVGKLGPKAADLTPELLERLLAMLQERPASSPGA
ncbi:site-specific integrase [Achromobacter mucicolens]|uniref:site-specific integrase n=1 Tax=Achromobacter mucicolens TaxID=1389922 RepID=UPI002FE3748E